MNVRREEADQESDAQPTKTPPRGLRPMVAVYTPGKPAKLRRGLFRSETGNIGSECPRRRTLSQRLSATVDGEGQSVGAELPERRADSLEGTGR